MMSFDYTQHEGDIKQLNIVMDIIENMLLNVYVLPKRSQKLKAVVPARASRKK